MAKRFVPVTLVSGFAQAGKSSLIEHLRRSLRARRAAFLAYALDSAELLDLAEKAIEMDGADIIVVENKSSAESYELASLLTEGDEAGRLPPKQLQVDTLVTVISADTFLRDVQAEVDLSEIFPDLDVEDDRTVPELLIEQIEFADVIVVNKIDLIDEAGLLRVEALLNRLNPRAKIVRAVHGRVRSEDVIGTGFFDSVETDDGAGWLAELEGFFDDWGEIEGVSSFTYVERRPFHPIRLNELLSDLHVKGLVRASGTIWVASRHHEIGVWSYAGGASMLRYGGAWFAATPARDWPLDERERAEIMSEWVPPFGDRRQEIAFIGIDLHEDEIREKLDECLLTPLEMKNGPDSWFSLPDPLPDWHIEVDEEI